MRCDCYFKGPSSAPIYNLEPHHTRRLTDGGPDHPRWVGAACPACHREIHHGEHGRIKNEALQDKLGTIEGETP